MIQLLGQAGCPRMDPSPKQNTYIKKELAIPVLSLVYIWHAGTVTKASVVQQDAR